MTTEQIIESLLGLLEEDVSEQVRHILRENLRNLVRVAKLETRRSDGGLAAGVLPYTLH